MTLYETAQAYHDAGLCTIPISPKAKTPALPGWKQYQSRKPDVSERWEWFGEHEDRNLAIIGGEVSGNLFVIDFDDKQVYLSWARAHKELVQTTAIVRTSKGYHVYLRAAEPVDTRDFNGGEVKGEGGYVVAPPSVHPSGARYEFVNAHDHNSIATVANLESLGLPLKLKDGTYKAEPAPEIIPEHTRNKTLASLAGSMRRRGLGYEEILGSLVVVNDLRCRPVLSRSEVERIAKSVLRYEPGDNIAQVEQEEPGQEDKEEAPEGWQIFTLADAYKPRPPIDYLVDGLFALPSLSIVYGAPGSFKTMLLVDLAAAVASGMPWLPPLPGKHDVTAMETLIFPVLWCDFDNGPRRMHERIEAVARARSLPSNIPLYYVSMPTPWLDGSDYDSVQYMAGIAQGLQAKLIIIDNLRDVSGGVEENSAAMGDVMSNFRRLCEDLDAAVIVIHHQRKSYGVQVRAGDTLRGHSSIEASLDLALLIDRDEHAETLTVRATKVRGEDVLPFGGLFTFDHKEGTKELAKVKFYGLAVEDVGSDAALRRTILETVQLSPKMNKGAVVVATKSLLEAVGINRIRQMIDILASDGALVITTGDNNSKVYSIPSGRDHFDVSIV